MTKNKARALVAAVVKMRELATDTQALEIKAIYPSWKADIQYIVGDRVLHNDVLYKVLTTHMSQTDWTPDTAPSLFAEVLIPDENVIPEWTQPDSTNAYMTGDKVMYGDKVWISIVDNNVWSPDAYGWQEVI
jgi:chitodextrinase